VATQRDEIAVLKAFGYTNLEVGRHFLRFALAAVIAGSLVGTAVGVWFGRLSRSSTASSSASPTSLPGELDPGALAAGLGQRGERPRRGPLGAVRGRCGCRRPRRCARRPPPGSGPGPLERWARRVALGRGAHDPAQRGAPAAARPASPWASRFALAILVVAMFFFDAVRFMVTCSSGRRSARISR
jgi:putative ABC transport system permease protein